MAQWGIDMRPLYLDSLYGLDNVKTYFHTRIEQGKEFPTSVLLSGRFGNAKTTTAKILAAMYTCRHTKPNGDPCWECPDCLAIKDETWNRDVIQLSGTADNKGSIVDKVTDFMLSPPMRGKRKVIIIEEAQALSPAAIDAFLKVTETPRKNFHFIFTAMARIPNPALMSRCSKFNFVPFSTKDILFYLKEIMEKSNLWKDESIPNEFRTKGLLTIASNSDGSLRAALNTLEQCLDMKAFTPKEIQDSIGLIDQATFLEAIIGLLDGKTSPDIAETLFNGQHDEQFGLLLKIISDACALKTFGTFPAENDYFREQAARLGSHPNFALLKEYTNKLNDGRAYLRKSDYITWISELPSASAAASTRVAPAPAESISPEIPVRAPISTRAVPPRTIPVRGGAR